MFPLLLFGENTSRKTVKQEKYKLLTGLRHRYSGNGFNQ